MSKPHKPDLRDKSVPSTSITDTDERLAGAEPKTVRPSSGKLRTPDVGHIPEGQATKG